ncbi:MAG: hypothetical protein AAGA81_23925 [Acidobacteriota bacterium]
MTTFDLCCGYTVNGVEYESWRCWPGGAAGWRALDFEVGDEVQLRDDPKRPERAMLETTYPIG